jgi:hypothetical protein
MTQEGTESIERNIHGVGVFGRHFYGAIGLEKADPGPAADADKRNHQMVVADSL